MKKNLFVTFLSVVILFLSSCSNIRVRYSADYKTPNGNTGRYVLKKSYPLPSSNVTWCYITGIFYGGACWLYLTQPDGPMRDTLKRDYQARLSGKVGSSDVVLSGEFAERIGWDNFSEEEEFFQNGQQSMPQTPSSSSGGDVFLR